MKPAIYTANPGGAAVLFMLRHQRATFGREQGAKGKVHARHPAG
jgi:hypothetical protein